MELAEVDELLWSKTAIGLNVRSIHDGGCQSFGICININVGGGAGGEDGRGREHFETRGYERERINVDSSWALI